MVGVALVIGAASLLVVLRRSMVTGIDQSARSRGTDVATQAHQGALPLTLSVPGEEDALVQVVDARGQVVASSTNLEGEAAIATFAPPASGAATRTLSNLPVGGGHSFRVVAVGADTSRGRVTVYVATSLAGVDDTIQTVQGILLAGSPLLLMLVAAMTWVIVGRALRPVEAIRAQVEEISMHALDRRVPEPSGDDEISRLAGTMNAMLGRLQTATDRQRRFVGDASHELQSPLASVRAELEVALAHRDQANWPAIAAEVLEEGDRMERLVRDLLFLARVDEAAPRPVARLIDLDDIVLEEVHRLNSSSRVTIDTTRVSSGPVQGRRDELQRVVRNLLDNAQRFATSSVTVSVRTLDGQVELVVADDGPGVPDEERERIFDRFAGLADSRHHQEGGTGLGLAIVREIVVGHGGTIVSESRGPGARLVVTIPASDR
ncbi:MAG: ATP-binding protein [Actinomycetota bacterium]|nr:ATP-binding protein [Actinomycetota bacterium]